MVRVSKNGGFICVNRKVPVPEEVFYSEKPSIQFIYLMLVCSSSHETGIVPRTSIAALAIQWGCSPSRAKKVLQFLKEKKAIDFTIIPNVGINIKILNFEVYNHGDSKSKKGAYSKSTAKSTAPNAVPNNINKEEKEEEGKVPDGASPSDERLEELAERRGY